MTGLGIPSEIDHVRLRMSPQLATPSSSQLVTPGIFQLVTLGIFYTYTCVYVAELSLN